MPVDSSIYFQQQNPDVIGSIEKGIKMSDMIRQNNISRQDQQRQQDIKAAYNAGTVQNPDGTIGFDQAKTLSALANLARSQGSPVSGQDVVTLQNQFTTQSAAQAEAKQKKQQDDAAYTFRALDPSKVKDDATWQAAKAQAIADGHQEAAQLPDKYDPNLQAQLLDHAKRVALTPQQFIEDNRKQQSLDSSQADRGVKREEIKNQKQLAELDKLGARLEQMRGSPAVSQAEKDIYAAKKVKSLVNLYGDPDKLDPQQVQLVASEVAKIATGGVPTTHELQGLNPATIPSGLASLSQVFLNEPTPANKGKFIKAMQQYTDSLTKDAQAVITDRAGRILNPYKSTYDKHPVYQGFQNEYLNRFTKEEAPQQQQPSSDDVQAAAWAKANPNDPRAAEILKHVGGQ